MCHYIKYVYCIYFHSDIYNQKLLSLSDFWIAIKQVLFAVLCDIGHIILCMRISWSKENGNEALMNNVHKKWQFTNDTGDYYTFKQVH